MKQIQSDNTKGSKKKSLVSVDNYFKKAVPVQSVAMTPQQPNISVIPNTFSFQGSGSSKISSQKSQEKRLLPDENEEEKHDASKPIQEKKEDQSDSEDSSDDGFQRLHKRTKQGGESSEDSQDKQVADKPRPTIALPLFKGMPRKF
jgi:hypothetical protein